MTRVTYSVAPSYHYNRSLIECSKFENVSPEVQRCLQQDLYVDDILTGANSEAESKLQTKLRGTVKQAKFDMRKRISNKKEINLMLLPPPKYRQSREKLEFFDTEHTNTQYSLHLETQSRYFCVQSSTFALTKV